MNPETENFDQLRKLLALKRYELPPPRYFNEFSGRVMARLTEPERHPLTWWQRLGFENQELFMRALMREFWFCKIVDNSG